MRIADQLLRYFVTFCYHLLLPVRIFMGYEDREESRFEYSL